MGSLSQELNEPMDVDSEPKKLMATGILPTFTVQLHPLVILSISDHWTRIRVQEGKAVPVFGTIVGRKHFKNFEVLDSFELVTREVDSRIVVDASYFKIKSQQHKEVFPDFEFLGWYAVSVENDLPDMLDADLHEQLVHICEPFLFMKVTYNPAYADLPVSIYETVEAMNEANPVQFVKLPFTIVTEESERIGIDQLVRTVHTDGEDQSVTTDYLNTQYNAVRMLCERLKVLICYINEVQQGGLSEDPSVLRAIKTLVSNLNKITPPSYRRAYQEQLNDVAVVTSLATVTKGTAIINQFINKMRAKHGLTESRHMSSKSHI